MCEQEIEQLYEQYSQDVFRLALSYLHNRQDAEDISQSVFLKLIDNSRPMIPGKEKSYLLTCTANACKNLLKSFWRLNTHKLIDSDLVFSDEQQRELWGAMQSLAPKDRALLHLYYYEGFAQDEIAKILGITRTAVQTRMQRARKNLEKELTVNE